MSASPRRVTAIVVVLTVSLLLGIPLFLRHSECARQHRAVTILEASSQDNFVYTVQFSEGGTVLKAARWTADHIDHLSRSGFCGQIVEAYRPVSGLSFHDAKLSADDWQAILGCRELSVLYLSGTNVSDAQVASLAALPSLEGLVVHDAKIGYGCRSLTPLSRLRHFAVSETNVSDDDLLALGSFPVLEVLRLSKTSVTDKCAPFVGRSRHLRELAIAHTGAGDAVAAELVKCPSMEELNLSYTQVSDVAIPNLLATGPCTDLSIQFSRITDDGLARLAEKRSLRQLTVDTSQVTTKSIAALKSYGKLKTLYVEGKNAAELKQKVTLLKTELDKTLVDSTLLTP